MNSENNRKLAAGEAAVVRNRKVEVPLNRSWPRIHETGNHHLGAGTTTHISIDTKSQITIKQRPRLGFEDCQINSKDRTVTCKQGPSVNRSMKPRRYSALINEAAIKCEMKYPMPPPRPTKTLLKKYQPLPPEPEESITVPPLRKSMSQSNTFPMTGKNTRQPWIKELEALGPSRVPELRDKQVLSLKSVEYALNSVPDHSIQSKLKCFPERPASRESHPAFQQKTEHIYVNLKNQLPTEKDLYSCNWYIKEFDRQEAEEALLQENCVSSPYFK
ncbi:cytokine-dependent hematopoietic cell linker [Lissotriton helveticus]